MNICLITEKNKKVFADFPCVPRKGEMIEVNDIQELYTEGDGESPLWYVTGVKYQCCRYTDVFETTMDFVAMPIVFITNEEDIDIYGDSAV